MARILLLTQQMIDRLVNDPDYREFPCLAKPQRLRTPMVAQPRARGCGGCGSRRRRRERKSARQAALGVVNPNAVKQAIINMPAKQQAALKSRLGCTGLKIQWRDHSSTIQRRVI